MKRQWQPAVGGENYEVKISFGKRSCKLMMVMHNGPYTTTTLPTVSAQLKKHLPSIFRSQCYNDRALPFSKEVETTEIGHLYEHILLEYLAIINRQAGTFRDFRGVTSWDWERDSKGTFHISIDVGSKDELVLLEALEYANQLMNQILDVTPAASYYPAQSLSPALALT